MLDLVTRVPRPNEDLIGKPLPDPGGIRGIIERDGRYAGWGPSQIATAPTQVLATEAARVCNPLFFHFPVREGSELPSYAFPFSPAEIERGQVFAFHLNHVVHTASPFELSRTRTIDVSAAPRKAASA